jgi:hypothetical protein
LLKRLAFGFAALALLSGCESLNGSLVRLWLMDHGYGREMNSLIREKFERKMTAPPASNLPGRPAPPFLDQG